MKNKVLSMALIILLSCLCACGKATDPEPGISTLTELIGAWGFQSYDSENDIWVYSKINTLSGDRNGYMFEEEGVLHVRTHGWCLTPPITYSNTQGSWRAVTGDTLVLTYLSAKRLRDYRLSILYLGESELHFRLNEIE
jgi:hypothetical protein